MTQYLLLVHGNLKSSPSRHEWAAFFTAASESGLFRGGSELGSRTVLGHTAPGQSTDHIVAYMRFDSDDKQQLLDLLEKHPVISHGGAAELCEMIQS